MRNKFKQTRVYTFFKNHGITTFFVCQSVILAVVLFGVVRQNTELEKVQQQAADERAARFALAQTTDRTLCVQNNRILRRSYKQDLDFYNNIVDSSLASREFNRKLLADLGVPPSVIKQTEEANDALLAELKPDQPTFIDCTALPIQTGE